MLEYKYLEPRAEAKCTHHQLGLSAQSSHEGNQAVDVQCEDLVNEPGDGSIPT